MLPKKVSRDAEIAFLVDVMINSSTKRRKTPISLKGCSFYHPSCVKLSKQEKQMGTQIQDLQDPLAYDTMIDYSFGPNISFSLPKTLDRP